MSTDAKRVTNTVRTPPPAAAAVPPYKGWPRWRHSMAAIFHFIKGEPPSLAFQVKRPKGEHAIKQSLWKNIDGNVLNLIWYYEDLREIASDTKWYFCLAWLLIRKYTFLLVCVLQLYRFISSNKKYNSSRRSVFPLPNKWLTVILFWGSLYVAPYYLFCCGTST